LADLARERIVFARAQGGAIHVGGAARARADRFAAPLGIARDAVRVG
jgi:hypothetical protein